MAGDAVTVSVSDGDDVDVELCYWPGAKPFEKEELNRVRVFCAHLSAIWAHFIFAIVKIQHVNMYINHAQWQCHDGSAKAVVGL